MNQMRIYQSKRQSPLGNIGRYCLVVFLVTLCSAVEVVNWCQALKNDRRPV